MSTYGEAIQRVLRKASGACTMSGAHFRIMAGVAKYRVPGRSVGSTRGSMLRTAFFEILDLDVIIPELLRHPDVR